MREKEEVWLESYTYGTKKNIVIIKLSFSMFLIRKRFGNTINHEGFRLIQGDLHGYNVLVIIQ